MQVSDDNDPEWRDRIQFYSGKEGFTSSLQDAIHNVTHLFRVVQGVGTFRESEFRMVEMF